LGVGKLNALILEIFKEGCDTVTFNGEVKFFGVCHLPATQPHFALIGFKNISFVAYFDKYSRSFPFTITIEEKPIDTKCQHQKDNE
jgi:hypothetical protein